MSTLQALERMNILEAQKRAGFTNAEEFIGDLVRNNDFLRLCTMLESSDGMFHKYLEATRLGKGSFGKVNGPVGIIASQSDLKSIPVHIFEGDSPIDERLFTSGTAAQKLKIRQSEDAANLEGFVQSWLEGLLYGDSSNPEDGFVGLSAMRATPDSKTTWDAGGSGSDCTSLWLFEFGPNGFNLRHPSGSRPGITSEDRGRHYVASPTGSGNFWAFVTHMQILAGVQVKRAGALQRLGSIETSGASNLFDPEIFIKMKNQLPKMGQNAVAFGNRTIHGQVETAAYNKSNASYSLMDIQGFGPVTMITGIPLMAMEAISDTEAAI